MAGRLAGILSACVALILAAAIPQGAPAQNAKRSPRQDGATESMRALTQAYNASGQALFRKFSAHSGNIVFSPYSIGAAMAMIMAGARGETEREMASVLQHTLGRPQIDAANAAVMQVLNSYDRSKTTPTCPRGMGLRDGRCESSTRPDGTCLVTRWLKDGRCVTAALVPTTAKLLVANALMMAGGEVTPDYAALLREKYAAEVFRGANLETLNTWVAQRTEGKITRILDRMSDLVLVNAVYFKSRWAVVFDKTRTKDEFFNITRSRQEMVPTMVQRTRYPLVTREGYRAIRVPYAVRQLAMVILLPSEVDGLPAVVDRVGAPEFRQLLTDLDREPAQQVILSLPRFRTEFTANLVSLFKEAGMRLAFEQGKADFTGMVAPSSGPAAIDQIVHRAVIEVAEESTEAAAVTAGGMRVASAPSRPVEPVEFRIDRPFLYYVTDSNTGAVLFQGRIVDPR